MSSYKRGTEVKSHCHVNKAEVLRLFANNAKYKNFHLFDNRTRAKQDKQIQCGHK